MATKVREKKFRFRLWIDLNDEKFFGPGRAELLQLIQQTGSISSAAKSMGMSYKKAWAMVDEMNSMSAKPLVVPQKGGAHGGGTELTETGKKIVDSYQKLLVRIDNIVSKEKNLLELI
jgi:molybdate transport system regulatory protein